MKRSGGWIGLVGVTILGCGAAMAAGPVGDADARAGVEAVPVREEGDAEVAWEQIHRMEGNLHRAREAGDHDRARRIEARMRERIGNLADRLDREGNAEAARQLRRRAERMGRDRPDAGDVRREREGGRARERIERELHDRAHAIGWAWLEGDVEGAVRGTAETADWLEEVAHRMDREGRGDLAEELIHRAHRLRGQLGEAHDRPDRPRHDRRDRPPHSPEGFGRPDRPPHGVHGRLRHVEHRIDDLARRLERLERRAHDRPRDRRRRD